MDLGVNIDHIALLRESRKIDQPDPIDALPILHLYGAKQVTIHLREDRRHIDDDDVKAIIKHAKIPVNLECSLDKDIIDFAINNQPQRVTLVPEKRQEITTEGGLDINNKQLSLIIKQLQQANIIVSLFIDPLIPQVKLSAELQPDAIELHTGQFANIFAMANSNLRYTKHTIQALDQPKRILYKMLDDSIEQIKASAQLAKELGMDVFAGHGLNYQNVQYISQIAEISELNIGQSIIAKSIFVGLPQAIIDMKKLIEHD